MPRRLSLKGVSDFVSKKWTLRSNLADLLDLSVETVRGYRENFDEAGFKFSRAGTRSRGELAWKVGKPNK